MTTAIEKTEEKSLTNISEFDEFETNLAEFKGKYVGMVYDLTDKKQRKQAGSDKLAIGKVVVRLDKAHKDIKAPLLAKTKLLDGERKRIKDELQGVQSEIGDQIKKHEDQIKQKAADLQEQVSNIVNIGLWDVETILNTEQLNARLDQLKLIVIDDSFEDRKGDAAIAKDETIQKIEGFIAVAKVKEIEAAEAEKDRLAQVAEDKRLETIQIEKDAKIKAEADAKKLVDDAKAETEAAQKRASDAEAKTKLDASEKERLEKKRADDAEAETKRLAQKVIDDAAQAVIDQEEAVKRESDRLEAKRVEDDRVEAENKVKREANSDNRRIKNNAAMAGFIKLGLSESAAKCAVKGVEMGLIPNMSITY